MPLFIRQSFLLLIFIALHQLSFAQETKLDTIVTQDYQKLVVPILEVTSTTITYQSQEEGPVTIPKAIIAYIGWGDGRKEELGRVSIKGISKLGPLRKWKLEKISSEQLREFYNTSEQKARKFRAMGLVGLAVGLIVPVTTFAYARSKDGNENFDNIETGFAAAILSTAALGGGATVAAIGFGKSRSYTRKKIRLAEELGRRNQPLHSLRLIPGFNPINQSGFLRLSMAF